MGRGMNGSHFHVLPSKPDPPPKSPNSKLSVTTTLTPKKPCREAALASGVTQTYELTHQPLAKTKHPEILFNTRVGLRSVIVPAVNRVIRATHTVHTITFPTDQDQETKKFSSENFMSTLYFVFCIYFLLTFLIFLLPILYLFCTNFVFILHVVSPSSFVCSISVLNILSTLCLFYIYFLLCIYFVSILCLVLTFNLLCT